MIGVQALRVVSIVISQPDDGAALSPKRQLEIIPLGGLGEFGMNLMIYRYGDDCILVDTGIMFPGEEHLGVDVVIPDLSYLDDCGTIHGIVLTHGHEDHIGALPYVLARHDVPVFSTAHAQGLVRSRFDAHDLPDRPTLHALPTDGETTQLGPFGIETIPVAHSIPQSKMVVLRTPVGTVLHTADYKLDENPPDGYGTDTASLRRLGREGVLALCGDSTNADRPGITPGEREATRGLDAVISGAPRRIVVTCFASNIQRVQQLAALAQKHGRRVALVGTSLQRQVEVAERLGLVRFPPGLRVAPEDVMDLPGQRALIVATGSQGEPVSALARIAVNKHRHVKLEDDDLVIHSAREIPGNEKSIGRMIDHLMRRGARVITAREAPVHVSGHPSSGELANLIDMVRPRFLVPIHGEYRQLKAHVDVARESGMDPGSVLLAESGDIIALRENDISIADRVHVGQVFIDAALDEVDQSLLRDRRRSAWDGIVVAVVAVDRDGGTIADYPQIVTRGFVPDVGDDDELTVEARRIVVASLAEATPEERRDEAMLKARIHTDLKRFLRRRTQRTPLIIPVIVEL